MKFIYKNLFRLTEKIQVLIRGFQYCIDDFTDIKFVS